VRWLALLLAAGCDFDPTDVLATGERDAREWDAPGGADAAALLPWEPSGFDPVEYQPTSSLSIVRASRYDTGSGRFNDGIAPTGSRPSPST
jgi:hypothetical protein